MVQRYYYSVRKDSSIYSIDYLLENLQRKIIKAFIYFDVWAPEIASHYGDVFWHDQQNQPLPGIYTYI